MFINNHKLNVTISLLLARVDRPAHILGYMKMISQLMVNFCLQVVWTFRYTRKPSTTSFAPHRVL